MLAEQFRQPATLASACPVAETITLDFLSHSAMTAVIESTLLAADSLQTRGRAESNFLSVQDYREVRPGGLIALRYSLVHSPD